MTVQCSMETYASRLASFDAVVPNTKKRTSSARSNKTLRWPHNIPSPPQLARAGFSYQPTSSRPDNTICYLCQTSLDGWEEDDDAVTEHLKHSPNCGWAIIAAIEQDIENGSYSLEDPMAERALDARRMTFGSQWPHESKRGWTCKIQKMVEAGWHYCPTLESDDFVRCAYCSLSLDGWEPKDKPFDEHQRRSPDCSFFTLYASINSKPSRSKKSRASKISRLSTQSDLTTTSEVPSVAEKDSTVDETIMSLSEIANPIKPARGAKKATKAKRPVGRAKGKETKAIKEGLQTSNGLLEPEDDTFEVKITSSPRPVANGKKRKSADMNSVHGNESQLEDPESHELTKKRRTTRASSMAEAQEIPLMALDDENELTAHSTDVAEMPPPSVPASKKKPKGSKKRTASSARKVSSASTATKASLRAAVPDDKEIEAALEAELNRTLTDEEGDEELIEARQSEGRRLTRTKAESTKATASVAPTRRGTRANSVAVNGPISDSHPLHVDDSGNAPDLGDEKAPEDRQMKEDIMSSPNVSSQEHGLSQKASTELQHQPGDVGHPEETVVANGNEAWNMRTAKSRTSPQSPECETLASDLAATTMVVREEVDAKDPIPNSQTVQENTQHETDTKQTRNIRGNRKASGTTRKPKQAKKTALTSKYVKGVVRGPMDTQSTGDTDEKSSMVSGFVGNGARVTTEPEPKKTQDQAKADTSPETKSKAGKVAAVREALIISSLEQPDVVMEVQDTPISPPISVMHSTPRPDRSSQSSDVENQPPSSRPSAHRPPLSIQSPSKSQVTRVPLAVTTPTRSPAKGNLSKLQSAFPWTAVDLDCIFQATPSVEKENSPFMLGARAVDAKTELTSPEKKLSVDQWIHLNAARGEEKLRNECERLVGKFEGEGVRALRTLEGILCIG